MHGRFCPIRLIHLIGRKSLHFEKKLGCINLIHQTINHVYKRNHSHKFHYSFRFSCLGNNHHSDGGFNFLHYTGNRSVWVLDLVTIFRNTCKLILISSIFIQGGLRGVIWTDVFQTLVILVGMITILVMVCNYLSKLKPLKI